MLRSLGRQRMTCAAILACSNTGRQRRVGQGCPSQVQPGNLFDVFANGRVPGSCEEDRDPEPELQPGQLGAKSSRLRPAVRRGIDRIRLLQNGQA